MTPTAAARGRAATVAESRRAGVMVEHDERPGHRARRKAGAEQMRVAAVVHEGRVERPAEPGRVGDEASAPGRSQSPRRRIAIVGDDLLAERAQAVRVASIEPSASPSGLRVRR